MKLNHFNPILWLRWMGQFVVGWGQSIRWRHAPRAIPAILLTIGIAMTIVVALNDGSSWRTDRLNQQWFSTLEAEDFDTAELVVMRQLHMRPDDSQLVYRLAFVRDAKGETKEASELMWRLVRLRSDATAARWLLQKNFLGRHWDTLANREITEVGDLLSLLHDDNPEDVVIHQQFADYLIVTKQYAEAIPVLSDLMRVQPMRGLQAAALSRTIGNDALADRLAERTLDQVSEISKEDPTNSRLALAVAQNQLFLKRYSEAVETLERALPRAKTEEEKQTLGQAVGDAYVAWINEIRQSPPEGVETRLRTLRMLERALLRAPNNARVLTLVADQVLAVMDDDEEPIVAVREALINGSSTGIAHFIRGTAALLRDDLDSATKSLKLASEHMPRSSAVLNNLAVAIASRQEPDLKTALKISETAIEQAVNPTPFYYETRGQILFRLEKYLEAIPDLERALAVQSLAREAHRSLATCYQQIGEPELSRRHREKADSMSTSDSL